ncbi:MAG: hypothetical protein K2K04_05010 [Clostridia bacterium]|nr:hypothetical protein [Clostridia bacterium]
MAKKMSNDEKIIAALDALDKSVRNLQKFGARYDEHIDNAAMRGDDKRAKQLIKQKIGVYALAEQLQTLKGNIELGAYTAQVMSDLGTLPAAIAGCKGLLSESPNFDKLGKSIKRIFKDMQKPADEISKLNDILDGVLAPQTETSLASRLDGTADAEESDQFKAEYAAMMDRIKTKVAPEAVAKPASSANAATGDIDYAGIVDEENKKN